MEVDGQFPTLVTLPLRKKTPVSLDGMLGEFYNQF
jgi:hypothetical protein